MFNQIGIIIFGCSAIWLVSRKEEWKRWGYILGLLGQPFWFYSAWENKQYGIMILTAFYTYSWSQGIYNYWIKK
jgi:nicotinamide riboside transporter PnuC